MRGMGEDRQDGPSTPPGRKKTVSEAAGELGISAEAVRSRIKRGTLRSVKDGSTVYVLLETARTTDQTRLDIDQTPPEPARTADQTELVEALREQAAYLQGVIATRDHELRERAEEIRRRDSALERQQELTAMFANRLRELETPQTSQESPRDTPEASEGTSTSPATEGAQESTESRPLWRRWLG